MIRPYFLNFLYIKDVKIHIGELLFIFGIKTASDIIGENYSDVLLPGTTTKGEFSKVTLPSPFIYTLYRNLAYNVGGRYISKSDE